MINQTLALAVIFTVTASVFANTAQDHTLQQRTISFHDPSIDENGIQVKLRLDSHQKLASFDIDVSILALSNGTVTLDRVLPCSFSGESGEELVLTVPDVNLAEQSILMFDLMNLPQTLSNHQLNVSKAFHLFSVIDGDLLPILEKNLPHVQ